MPSKEEKIKLLISHIENVNKQLENRIKKYIKNGSLSIFNQSALENFIESIKPESEYSDYLKDKKIAFTGPSKYLLDGEYKDVTGAHIDSHDIIARIKVEDYLPFQDDRRAKKCIKQIGVKTNINYSWKALLHPTRWGPIFGPTGIKFYRNPNAAHIRHVGQERQQALGLSAPPFNSIPNSERMRHIVKHAPYHSDKDTKTSIVPEEPIFPFTDTQFDHYGFSEYIRETAKADPNAEHCKTALKQNDKATLKLLFNKSNPANPHLQTGSAGLFEILTTDYSEIYITGITFYHGGGNMFQNKKGKHSSAINSGHDGTLEMKLFIDFLIYEIMTRGSLARIKVDDVLCKIIKKYTDIYKECLEQKKWWSGRPIYKEVDHTIKSLFEPNGHD